jgi:hypothetical protein
MLERHAQAGSRTAKSAAERAAGGAGLRRHVSGLWMQVALGDPVVQEAWAKTDQVVEELFDLIMDWIRAKGEES